MDQAQRNKINRLAIKALVSVDHLFGVLALKGGNALDLIYELAQRASIDVDFSIASSFDDSNLGVLRDEIRRSIADTFGADGYHAFDVRLDKRPSSIPPDLDGFWGGYKLQFKIISTERYRALGHDLESLRRNALAWGANNSPIIQVDISRHEYFPLIELKYIDGYAVKVYSPTLIAIEKLRAICQQMEEYRAIVPTVTRSPRARDFFDIYTIVSTMKIDLLSTENRDVLGGVFDAKRVPLGFLRNLEKYREFHRSDFVAVRATIGTGTHLEEFDFYFDFVKSISEKL
jgi:predicted nucleotidyltransferase component of viral defense system